MDRKKALGLESIASVVILIAIVIVANLIAVRFFGRIDLTDGDVYSLSEFSKKTVRDLDNDVTVKAYFTSNLPAPYNFNARFIKDKLDDYKAYSKGKFHYEFIDPSETAELEEEAQKFRIQPAQINLIENDQVQIKKVYMGLALLYEDKQEVIPIIQQTNGLEYDLSSALLKLTRDEIVKVGFLTGHDEPDLYEKLAKLQQLLSQLYQVQAVDLSSGSEVPADLKTLVIVGPKKAFTNWEKFAIDQFIMRGGKIAFLMDKINTDISTGQAMPTNLELDDWLQTYGIKVNNDLIVDAQNRQITVSYRQGFFQIQNLVRYPYIPIVNHFSTENAIVKDLETVDFAFVSSIDSSATVGVTGVKFEPLLWSSQNSGSKTGMFNISPQQEFSPADFAPGNYILAGAYVGQFKSYFAGKPIPNAAEGDTSGLITPTMYDKPVVDQSVATRIVVVGDADFVQDQLQTNPANLIFFQNIVDWLTQDEGLITIRSREATDRQLEETSDGVKKFVKFGNILGIPALVAVIGLAHWSIRRSRKSKGVIIL